ncbi:MAG: cryptochrome/photolyase family protein [Alphaproteobacteria bacterium]|nr:MAG: cryptochrome/photolyase family protein [Alphaproteobacteria bacterium]
MSSLRVILGDQLSQSLTSLQEIDKTHDTVMLCEVMEEATYVPHHPKKIAFLFSAMRHFADMLHHDGVCVRYIKLDDPQNTGSFTGEVMRAIHAVQPQRIVVHEAGEYRVNEMMKEWQRCFAIPVDILPDNRFLATHEEFAAWIKDKKQFRMEFFYREMRKKYGILIEPDGSPTGGEWNYDKENRKPPKSGMTVPKRIRHAQSSITREVLTLVHARFSHHFGTLEPFHYAVTRAQALMEFEHFIQNLLPHFGDYQDAMVAREPYLYHSLISSYLNAGLLLPLELCQKVEDAYRTGAAPLNAVEGFIRQILGWREYIRGMYWQFMPEYGTRNYLNATRPLPDFYWGAQTHMFCIAETVRHTREHAYSHHIQRLMVTGNFALLAGLDVTEVQAWYLAVYSDAYEWVEMPNTLGMALYGDGGAVASKPYAASGKYIHRMSNYCEKCRYDPEQMTGEKACPFNALYWDFMVRHESIFRGNQRMPYVFSTWDKFAPEKQRAIRAQAQMSLQKMQEGVL